MTNKNQRGDAFTEKEILAVWKKGKIVPNYDPDTHRRDSCGAMMEFDQHGNTNHYHGWEIDHIKLLSKGGNDDLSNLQPLQWENNRHKGDDYPDWECKKRF